MAAGLPQPTPRIIRHAQPPAPGHGPIHHAPCIIMLPPLAASADIILLAVEASA